MILQEVLDILQMAANAGFAQTEVLLCVDNKTKSKCGEITATKITLIIESDEDSNPDFPDIFMEEMLLNFSIKTKTNIKSVAMEDL